MDKKTVTEVYIKVPKKALKYRTAGMVAYNAEWLKNHFDIERVVICGVQEPCEDAISRDAVLDYIHRILNQGTGKKKSFEFIRKYVEKLPPVKPQKSRTELKYCDRNICLANEYNGIGCDECEVQEPTDENLHREREQAYMLGYEDASKRFRQEPSEDAISRQAIQTELKNCEVVDMYDKNDNLVGYYNADTVDSIVRNLPSVNPQPICEEREKGECPWYAG